MATFLLALQTQFVFIGHPFLRTDLSICFQCLDIAKPIPDTPPQAQKGQEACLLASFERFGAHRPAVSKQSSGKQTLLQ